MENAHINPPKAKIIPKKLLYHGTEFIDNYFWLREKENTEVIEYLQAENNYFEKIMEDTKDLQEELYEELVSRRKEDDESIPEKMYDYYYYDRVEKGKQYKFYCRKKTLDGPEEVFLDLNKVAEGNNYVKLGGYDISPDSNFLAYTIDYTGYENFVLYIKNLKSNELKEFKIDKLSSDVTYSDNNTLFITKLNEVNISSSIFRIDDYLNFDSGKEVLIFEEKDLTRSTSMRLSKDKKYLFIVTHSKEDSEYYFLNLSVQVKELKIFKKKENNVIYHVFHNNNYFYILTNKKALNFKVYRCPVNDYEDESKWELFIDHNEDIRLYELDMFKEFIVLYNRKNGLNNVAIFNISQSSWHDVQFEDPLYDINDIKHPLNHEFDSKSIRIYYSTLNRPYTTLEYNMETKQFDILKIEEIRNFKSEDYIIERKFVEAADGKKIPLSLIYNKNINKNKSNPTMLYGYGSYGISMDPGFRPTILSLLERGFVYAIAHIRGGEELGRSWYLDGKYLNKKNTFNDFISCAEYLIKEEFTSKDYLGIQGGSAGGLLIGAVLNINPDLFKSAILDVPFVDVVNTMMDETIPLTTIEYDEWGNPNEKKYFDYMLSYSPYENLVKREKYPSILVTTGLNDPRVQYWEPTKYVAKLRSLKTDNNLLLFKINMGAGHGGSSGKYDYLKEIAFRYAFLIKTIINK